MSVGGEPRGVRDGAKRSVPASYLPPAPYSQLGGEEQPHQLVRGADVLHALLRHDGVAEHLPPRSAVALEPVGGGWIEPVTRLNTRGRHSDCQDDDGNKREK